MVNLIRVKVVNAPGYPEEWEAILLTYFTHTNGRSGAVLESEDGKWHVLPQEYVREPRTENTPYDKCGCIAPCPNHHSPRDIARQDRMDWDSRYDREDEE